MARNISAEAIGALQRYFEARVAEEKAKPPNEFELRRAEAAKQYWLANGLIKRSQYPS